MKFILHNAVDHFCCAIKILFCNERINCSEVYNGNVVAMFSRPLKKKKHLSCNIIVGNIFAFQLITETFRKLPPGMLLKCKTLLNMIIHTRT